MVSGSIKLIWPLKSHFTIVSPQGRRQGSATVSGWHSGIDIRAPENTPLLAPINGDVTAVAYQFGGAGHFVKIRIPGTSLEVRMMHLARKPEVVVGDKVTAGTVIGYTGNSGRSQAPHLHIDIRDANTANFLYLTPQLFSLTHFVYAKAEYEMRQRTAIYKGKPFIKLAESGAQLYLGGPSKVSYESQAKSVASSVWAAVRVALNVALSAPQTGRAVRYVVKKGDSLSKISLRQYGDAKYWKTLYTVNRALLGVNPNLIKPGQELVLPAITRVTSNAPITSFDAVDKLVW